MNSLGFDKLEKDTRVVVAMSGGVDSSVCAALMKEQGYDVIGITLQLYDYGSMPMKKGACCAGQDIYDAAQVAQRINIPHYIFDYENKFKESVIDEFVESYMRGETPVPCIRCNQSVKFQDLLNSAKKLQADAMVTGHYAQRLMGEHGPELHRGLDPAKDQSYFLFATTKDELDYIRFPLGGMSKTETRAHALRFGLEVADKPDSQDICFVPNGDYASVITKIRPDATDPGEIVDLNGTVLGHHKGIIHYTVGQRKRLYINSMTPKFVVKIDPELKQVIVGDKEDLQQNHLTLSDINWLHSIPMQEYKKSISVKIRSSGAPINATIENESTLLLESPEYGVSAGQACVIYDGNRVLGGGWIQ